MEAQPALRFNEYRRALRVPCDRPARITQPIQVDGRVLDASAVGLLLRVEWCSELRKGDWIVVEIPRTSDGAVLCRRGRIVRLEFTGNQMLLGLDLN